jgi:hypothetical protein
LRFYLVEIGAGAPELGLTSVVCGGGGAPAGRARQVPIERDAIESRVEVFRDTPAAWASGQITSVSQAWNACSVAARFTAACAGAAKSIATIATRTRIRRTGVSRMFTGR